jgi:hypothetical protein
MEVSMHLHLLDTNLIALAVVAILIIAVLVLLYVRKHKTSKDTPESLRKEFGPGFDRPLREHASEQNAEAQLEDRENRVENLNFRDFAPMEHEPFSKRWESVQSRFIESPKAAVTEADDLVSSLMRVRGYPLSDFEERSADISVDHPRVMEGYRVAHEIALRVERDEATTEELRTAMIHFRSLVEELTQTPASAERKEVA